MFELTLRIGFSLVVVFVLMWGIAKVIRKPLAGRGGELLSVVTRQQLTRNSSVAVVRLADRALVVGVTDSQVTLLAETDLATLENYQPTEPARRGTVSLVPPPAPAVAELPVAVGQSVTQDPIGQGAHRAPAPAGRLAGSALSPQTWAQTIEFLRARTVRK